METVYTVCAAAGVTVMLAQVALTLFGLDSDTEPIGDVGDDLAVGDELADHHGTSNAFFGILTFRSVTAFIAFFGLGGRIALAFDLPGFVAFVSGSGIGLVAMVAVALLMRALYELKSEGNVHIQHTLGSIGTVYLTIPGQRSGVGKVTVSLQDRTMEFQAVTNADAIKTGRRVKVVGISDPSTLEVALDEGSTAD